MSSIATFYLLPETGRAEFTDAHRNQKSITYKRSLFGRKEVITGERFLWEYLDSAATDRTELPFSGFPLIDYLFTFVATNLPENLQAALSAAAMDEHYYAISADLAAKFAEYLQSYTKSPTALSTFAAEHNPSGGAEYLRLLTEAHHFVLLWFRRIVPGNFGVLHITF